MRAYLEICRGWRRVCTRFHRMCSNKINGICRACKFYGRTGPHWTKWRGNGVCIKEGGRPWTGKWASGKVDRVKRRLIVAFARFWLSALQWPLPITIDATTKTGLSSSRRCTLYVKRESMLTRRIEIYIYIFHGGCETFCWIRVMNNIEMERIDRLPIFNF